MTKTLYLLRGCSGSGKTTLAEELKEVLPDAFTFAADDYFYDKEGNYNWDATKLGQAHKWCQNKVEEGMNRSVSNIIVHNTNTSEKELNIYIKLAEKYDYKIVSLIVENRHGCSDVHSVSYSVKKNQERKLMQSIKLL